MSEPKLLLDYYKIVEDCKELSKQIEDHKVQWSRDNLRVHNKRLKLMQGEKKRLRAKLLYLRIAIPNLQDSK